MLTGPITCCLSWFTHSAAAAKAVTPGSLNEPADTSDPYKIRLPLMGVGEAVNGLIGVDLYEQRVNGPRRGQYLSMHIRGGETVGGSSCGSRLSTARARPR